MWKGWAAWCSVVVVAAGLAGCHGLGGRGKGRQASSIFEAFSPPTPAVAAAWATDEYDADKRYRGMLLLANAPFGGERAYVEMYAKATADGDPAVRSAAVRGLALHGSPEHVPLIAKHLDDPDRLLRWECARALQRVHNAEAIGPLLKHLGEKEEPEAMVRAAAADALGQYAQPRVLDGLIAAVGDRDLVVNDAAIRSLRTLTGQEFGTDMRGWVAWKKSSDDPFAGRTAYIYPVFRRDKTFVETVLPIFSPPNEIAAAPAGMVSPTVVVRPSEAKSAQDEAGAIRNN